MVPIVPVVPRVIVQTVQSPGSSLGVRSNRYPTKLSSKVQGQIRKSTVPIVPAVPLVPIVRQTFKSLELRKLGNERRLSLAVACGALFDQEADLALLGLRLGHQLADGFE